MSALQTTLPAWAAGNARIAALIEQHQALAPAYEEFGLEQFQAGNHQAAIQAFEAAVALNPQHAVYLNNLGVAQGAAGNAKAAIAALYRSLEIDKDQAQIWLNLGYTVKALGRLDEAEQALTQAAGHTDTAAEALAALSQLAMARGDNEKVVAYFQQAVKGDGGNATLHGTLGAALFQSGKPGEAATEYALAAALAPHEKGFRDNAAFLTMLDGVIQGNAEAAITAYAAPMTEDETLRSALDRALVFLTSFGHEKAARAMVGEWVQYYPEDEDALYFQQIFSGKAPARAPAGYIAQHFDRLADVLDARTLKAMDYRVPEHMAGMFENAVGDAWRGNVLDAGCGNGASAGALKKFATRLTGIDLSPRMAALAKASGLYDDVVTADLPKWLQTMPRAYDLILAADSLIYFGALEFVFAAAHMALRPGGWFMLSVETNDGSVPYTLLPSGRFAHAKSYVATMAADDFTVEAETDLTLRLQGVKPVKGAIFLLRKT